MRSRTAGIDGLIYVAGGVEGINSMFETLCDELATRDGCCAGRVEHGTNPILD